MKKGAKEQTNQRDELLSKPNPRRIRD